MEIKDRLIQILRAHQTHVAECINQIVVFYRHEFAAAGCLNIHPNFGLSQINPLCMKSLRKLLRIKLNFTARTA